MNERIKAGHDYNTKGDGMNMTDGSLIGYCGFRVDTPRGLINKQQLSRMIFLAGSPSNFLPPDEILSGGDEWFGCGTQFDDARRNMKELIKLALDIKAGKTILLQAVK